MKDLTKQIIEAFDASFCPQEIAVAEQMFHRFVAGDSLLFIAADYQKLTKDAHAALRFFILKTRGNKTIEQVYRRYRKLALDGI